MRLLLDTHSFLWWSSAHGARLSERGRDLLGDGATGVSFSVVSAWEIAIKVGSGRLGLPDAVERYIPDRVRQHGFDMLPIELSHVFRAGSLPPFHRDPFDRLLVAQAQIEGIPILTADPAISQYDIETIW